jgi:hypothetical protein
MEKVCCKLSAVYKKGKSKFPALISRMTDFKYHVTSTQLFIIKYSINTSTTGKQELINEYINYLIQSSVSVYNFH